MSVVKLATALSYDLQDLWEHNVHEKALILSESSSPVYLVFVDGEDSYLYFPGVYISHVDSTHGQTMRVCNKRMSSLTPVLCCPPVDMSTTRMVDLLGDNVLPSFDCAVRDITLSDILPHSEEASALSVSSTRDT